MLSCRYNTYIAHYKELECMRISLEPLLYKYGVDIIFAGCVASLTWACMPRGAASAWGIPVVYQ